MKYFTLFSVTQFAVGYAAAAFTLLAVNWMWGPIGSPMLNPVIALPLAVTLFFGCCTMGMWMDNQEEEEEE